MKRTVLLMVLLTTFFITKVIADPSPSLTQFADFTIENFTLASQDEFYLEIYAQSTGDEDIKLGYTELPISFNTAVLSNPILLEDQHPDFSSGDYQMSIQPSGEHVIFTITYNGPISGGTTLPRAKTRLAGISFFVDQTADPSETAGIDSNDIYWVKNSAGETIYADWQGGYDELLVCPHAPVISGEPVTSIVAGDAFNFIPWVGNGCGILEYEINIIPAWADFNTETGALSGTPEEEDVGITTGIVITVTDTNDESDSLPAFDISVTSNNTSSNDTGGSSDTGGSGGGGGCFIDTLIL